MTVSLLPLSTEHAPLLQAVYESVPAYWTSYQLTTPPYQAKHDLAEMLETPGRTILGIIRPRLLEDGAQSAEMVGALDFRLYYPDAQSATLGLILVAESVQRSGIGRAAWALLEPWLGEKAHIERVRASVEQFNLPALRYLTALGFAMTADAMRVRVGDTFVRRLTMQKAIGTRPTSAL